MNAIESSSAIDQDGWARINRRKAETEKDPSGAGRLIDGFGGGCASNRYTYVILMGLS